MIKLNISNGSQKSILEFENFTKLVDFFDKANIDLANKGKDYESYRFRHGEDNSQTWVNQLEASGEYIDFGKNISLNTYQNIVVGRLFRTTSNMVFNNCEVNYIRHINKPKISGENNKFIDCSLKQKHFMHKKSLQNNEFIECQIDSANDGTHISGNILKGCSFIGCHGTLPVKDASDLKISKQNFHWVRAMTLEIDGTSNNIDVEVYSLDSRGVLFDSKVRCIMFIGMNSFDGMSRCKVEAERFAVKTDKITYCDINVKRMDSSFPQLHLLGGIGIKSVDFTGTKISIDSRKNDEIDIARITIDKEALSIIPKILDASKDNVLDLEKEMLKAILDAYGGEESRIIKIAKSTLNGFDVGVNDALMAINNLATLFKFLGVKD